MQGHTDKEQQTTEEERNRVTVLEIAASLAEERKEERRSVSACERCLVELSAFQQQLLPLGIWILCSSSFPKDQVAVSNFSCLLCGTIGYIRPEECWVRGVGLNLRLIQIALRNITQRFSALSAASAFPDKAKYGVGDKCE